MLTPSSYPLGTRAVLLGLELYQVHYITMQVLTQWVQVQPQILHFSPAPSLAHARTWSSGEGVEGAWAWAGCLFPSVCTASISIVRGFYFPSWAYRFLNTSWMGTTHSGW